MRSSVSLALLLLAGCGNTSVPATGGAEPTATPTSSLPPGAPASDGPSGTSGTGPERYDHVGLASWYGDLEGDAATAAGAAWRTGRPGVVASARPAAFVAVTRALSVRRSSAAPGV